MSAKLAEMWAAVEAHKPAPEYADAWMRMLKERTVASVWAAYDAAPKRAAVKNAAVTVAAAAAWAADAASGSAARSAAAAAADAAWAAERGEQRKILEQIRKEVQP
ncbi:MAG: hypothetical protein IOD05_07375 [Rhodobacter sp.]|nr:hypothetical protein [Rhodobacter sp.]